MPGIGMPANVMLPNYGAQDAAHNSLNNPNPGVAKKYRPDIGTNMTDAEYSAYQQNHANQVHQQSQDINTNAQKALMSTQGDIQSRLGKEGAGYQSQQMTQAGGIREEQMRLEASLQSDAEARRLQQLQGLVGNFQSSLNGGGPDAQYKDISQYEDSARNAAFARAKDTAGQTGRAALNSLMNVQGAKGIVGSSLGGSQAAPVVNQAATQLGDVNREQYIQDLANARQRASEEYQGRITQRGQNINMTTSMMSPLFSLLGARY